MMFTILKKVKNKLKRTYECYKRRKKLKFKDFSIISNNCWGGFIYQMFNLPYTTPTIGLFIYEHDYVKFCGNLKHYLEQELEFIDVKNSKYYNKVTKNQTEEITYPVAKLGDIEVFFMHYKTKEEAVCKWNRRKARINFDRLLFKMSEREDRDEKTTAEFCTLPYKNKICFTEDEQNIDCCVKVNGLKELNESGGGDETKLTLKAIDIYKLLNDMK